MAHGADLLVHEATFATEEADRAAETGHSTARGAAELAAAAEVALLALTHVSPRYPPDDLRAEAREVFEATIVPRDFDRVEIPFPERGAPVHIRADRARSQPETSPLSDFRRLPVRTGAGARLARTAPLTRSCEARKEQK